jgi:pyruvate formate lyase activating enzyme
MEVTTLVVPGQNDSDDELKQVADFLFNTCGADVPWHVSRFYPQYKYSDAPSTPETTLQRAYNIAKAAGLHYVYIGNLRTIKGENTYCPKCKRLLIEREGFYVTENNVKNGCCCGCNEKIAGFELGG